LVVAKPVVSNANSKNRRSHNTAERINCISKVLHMLEPPKTQPSIIYTEGQALHSFASLTMRSVSSSTVMIVVPVLSR
jgi:hypothetical protein